MDETLDSRVEETPPPLAEPGVPQPPVAPPQAPAPPPFRLLRPLVVVLAGVALIAGMNLVEQDIDASLPWQESILAPDSTPEAQDVAGLLLVRSRELPLLNSLFTRELLRGMLALPEGGELVHDLGLDHGEHVVFALLPRDELRALLVSGRLPVPGKPEALGGDLAARSSFMLDQVEFKIVGRLNRSVAALSYAYLIPSHPAFADLFRGNAAKEGWIDPEGLDKLKAESMAEMKEPAHPGEDDKEPTHIIGGMVRCLKTVSTGVTIGLILVAIGGAWAQFRVFRRLAVTSRGPVGPAVREVARHPLLFAAVNVALYGAFFCAMFAGIHFPVASAHVSRYFGNEFARGDLSYIGAAYASGNIREAIAATFWQNYFVATMLFTILPSLVVPFSGFIKNLLTFGSVGFVMSPLWTQSIFGLIYHSITMTLELESYVVASFVTILFPVAIGKGLLTGNFIRSVGRGFLAMASVAILAAIMLAIAASYEATTLILLR